MSLLAAVMMRRRVAWHHNQALAAVSLTLTHCRTFCQRYQQPPPTTVLPQPQPQPQQPRHSNRNNGSLTPSVDHTHSYPHSHNHNPFPGVHHRTRCNEPRFHARRHYSCRQLRLRDHPTMQVPPLARHRLAVTTPALAVGCVPHPHPTRHRHSAVVLAPAAARQSEDGGAHAAAAGLHRHSAIEAGAAPPHHHDAGDTAPPLARHSNGEGRPPHLDSSAMVSGLLPPTIAVVPVLVPASASAPAPAPPSQPPAPTPSALALLPVWASVSETHVEAGAAPPATPSLGVLARSPSPSPPHLPPSRRSQALPSPALQGTRHVRRLLWVWSPSP